MHRDEMGRVRHGEGKGTQSPSIHKDTVKLIPMRKGMDELNEISYEQL